MAWALSELENQGVISTGSMLAQKSETSADEPKSEEAMDKYLEIARELVRLNDQLPTIKLCMADVQAGKYTPSNAANLALGNKIPDALKDPATGKPLEIIIDGKATELIDTHNSKLISGIGKVEAAAPGTTKPKVATKEVKKAAAAKEGKSEHII